jgi:hypothetical protein
VPKPKQHRYHASMRWTDEEGHEFSMQTQLYEISGVYTCLYQDGRMIFQGGYTPARLARLQAKQAAELKAQGIEVTLGREKVVEQNADGYWVEARPA